MTPYGFVKNITIGVYNYYKGASAGETRWGREGGKEGEEGEEGGEMLLLC